MLLLCSTKKYKLKKVSTTKSDQGRQKVRPKKRTYTRMQSEYTVETVFRQDHREGGNKEEKHLPPITNSLPNTGW